MGKVKGLREKCLGEKRKSFCRERSKRNEKKNRAEAIYTKMNLDGLRSCRELLSTNSRQIYLSRCYQASVKGKETLMDQTAIEQTETISMD